ncbi:MAG TPA: folylpolyglutamate synthase/dihydrofolate synthase family protein [Clostridia bacterium]|nr:folylpolyglutamate synthase/dihydrofolate synthase family protein [Clostridia bacterium]
MNYLEAVDFITNVEKFGSVFGLETVRELLRRLGNPDKNLRFVHIAGTNGKGSVSSYLTSILVEAGYKVGTFNSPSVFCYNERYLVNGIQIDDETVARLLSVVRDARAQMETLGLALPTAFEIEFAVALLWFAECKCDIVVLETGLGGRLDATNVIEKKELAIITSIGLDHTKILGDTVAKIAAEKVAIVKDCPLVTFCQSDEVMKVLSCVKDLRLAETPESICDSLSGQVFELNGKRYAISMLGSHQLENASLVVKACEVLSEKGFEICETALKNGLLKAKWAGRMEILSVTADNSKQTKTIILDGAHNPDGARILQNALSHYFKEKKIALVFGMFADKDVEAVANAICKGKEKIIMVTPPSKRGLNASELEKIALQYCSKTLVAKTIEEGVCMAIESDCEVVCVCGSLSILSAARKEILLRGEK